MLSNFDLSTYQWMTLLGAAFIVGLSKAGVKGMTMFIVVMMAYAYPAKESVGMVLLMFCTGDLMAINYYRRDAQWSLIWRLLPAALVGIGLGVWLGYYMDEQLFRRILAIIVITGLLLIIWQERRPISNAFLERPTVSATAGLLGGFTTMVGNAAGPVMAVYLLATRLPKLKFIGTAAWFFVIVNFIKIPFHIWVWKSMTAQTLPLNLIVIPLIAIGFFLGIRIIHWLPEKGFRYFVIIATAVAGIRLLLA